MSLARAILNFNESESALGLSYVTVSWVKTLRGLMFESAFNLSRFKEVKGKTPKDRAEDVRIRIGQLSRAGQLLFIRSNYMNTLLPKRQVPVFEKYLMSHLML